VDFKQVMEQLEQLGSEQTKRTLINHGAHEPLFGVKVGDMKKLVKHVKGNHELALQLYASGNYDAMYLAGLSVNPKLMTKEALNEWVNQASWSAPAEYTVAWVTAESHHALELARQWIEDEREMVAVCGWSTYANYLSITANELLDPDEIRKLLAIVKASVHGERNRVRYVMNSFVIAVGSYVPELTEEAKSVAAHIGKVEVNVGNTACKVPLATEYIDKVEQKGRIGVKRKTCIC